MPEGDRRMTLRPTDFLLRVVVFPDPVRPGGLLACAIDLNVFAAGANRAEVLRSLDDAVSSYLDTVFGDCAQQGSVDHLLNRPAMFGVRLRWHVARLASSIARLARTEALITAVPAQVSFA